MPDRTKSSIEARIHVAQDGSTLSHLHSLGLAENMLINEVDPIDIHGMSMEFHGYP